MSRTWMAALMRALVAVLIIVLALAGCTAPTEDAPDVVATFYPLAFLAESIAGGDLRIGTLVPPGVEPHDWEPAPADVAKVASARLILTQGAGFEPWLGGLLANADASATIVETTSGLPLRDTEGEHEGEEAEGGFDPHTWLDPSLYARQAQAIEDGLVRAFPEHADAFRERGAALRADLAALDGEFATGLSTCEIEVAIANHDAYGYLSTRYGFRVEAVSGLSPEAEPSPADMARVIDVAREHNITIVFFEELASERVAATIAREVGATTRVLSPVEGLTGEQRAAGENYFTLMRANLAGLREAMRCP